MSESHDGPTIVVVTPSQGEAGKTGEGGEVQASDEVEAVSEVADAAVEIARIEADRDVTLAVIQEEASVDRAEAYASEELEQCRLRIAELEGQNTAQAMELERLTHPPSSELPLNPQPEAEAVVVVAEPEPAASQEAEAPEPEKPRRKPHRWI